MNLNHWRRSIGTGTVYDFSPIDIDGNKFDLGVFRGNVLLITNVASACGGTQSNYDAMTDLSNKYNDDGLRILCFPCNQFQCQETGDDDKIKQFVNEGWPNLKAQLFSKSFVNGPATEPIYEYLKAYFPGNVGWNFASKFIVVCL